MSFFPLNYLFPDFIAMKVRPHRNNYRGIPQGLILGPLLFNIFLNDLLLDFKTTEICNFADDNSLYKGNRNLQILNDILKSGITEVLEWFSFNSLVANPEKFQILSLSPRTKKVESFTISIDGKVL